MAKQKRRSKQPSKRLRVIAGPNGSGKSTIADKILALKESGDFINADIIEKTIGDKKELLISDYHGLIADEGDWEKFLQTDGKGWVENAKKNGTPLNAGLKDNKFILLKGEKPNGYDAAIIADFIRHRLIANGVTFTFETVLSGVEKIDFLKSAKQKQYKIYLYFVATVDPKINVDRVKQRAKLGGHNVPEKKIIERYHRSLEIMSKLFPLVYRAYVFDNSVGKKAKLVLELTKTRKVIKHETKNVPWWVDQFVVNVLSDKR